MKFLVDTGANRNYVCSYLSKNPEPVLKPFYASSPCGKVKIDKKIVGKFFQPVGIETLITFFVLPSLKEFDGIIGDDTLKALEALVDRKNNLLVLGNNVSLPLKAQISETINSTLNGCLSTSQCEKISHLIKKFEPLFGPINTKLTVNTAIRADIRTLKDEPIYSKSYPYPACMRAEIEKQINELLYNGIIRPSRSPYNSPIWIVPKKPKPNGEKQYRMVIDYKRLNAVTIPDTYPIPDINATLASLGNAKYFTVLDLTLGFHQIPMKESEIPKTAFSTMNGKYEFLRLPFGLKNAPAIFQRAIDDVLKPFIGRICYVYIDDIIVFGNSEESHLKNVETVFATLLEANFKVNLEKTHFMKTEVEFLGYVITPERIKADIKKVETI